MSLRAVWVINRKGDREVLFSRRYPTVERRAKTRSVQYHPVPSDSEWLEAVLIECREAQHGDEFVEERDTCDKSVRKPVYEIFNGKQWPVVVLEKYGLIFCCLPLVESIGSKKRPSLVEVPGVSVGFDFLQQMAEFLGPQAAALDITSPKFRELYNYLNIAAPFGSPVDGNPNTVKSVLQMKLPPWTSKQKQPAWKPFLYKGNPRLQFAIKEEIWAVQYDSKTAPDVWEIAGTITCKAELEGVPDVSVNITVPAESSPLDHVVVHPCVQSGDTEDPPLMSEPSDEIQTAVASSSMALKSRKLKFSPPIESFVLCRYMASSVPKLPIRGFYQMKGDRVVKLLVQLKLSEKVKNQFEFCEVHLPFFNRGPIVNADVSPTSANVTLSTDKKVMIWNVGNRFPSKSLEVFLNASVFFGEHLPASQSPSAEDPFCVGLNAYIEIHFKMADFTLSGCNIDQRSVTVYPNVKPKLISVREFYGMSYRIWNSHGDAPMALPFSQVSNS